MSLLASEVKSQLKKRGTPTYLLPLPFVQSATQHRGNEFIIHYCMPERKQQCLANGMGIISFV